MRFAIISFAHIHAWSYARVLRELENAELVAIYDDDRARLKEAAERAFERFVRELVERWPRSTLVLFGSRAKGWDRPGSDYDIAVLFGSGDITVVDEVKLAVDLAKALGVLIGWML